MPELVGESPGWFAVWAKIGDHVQQRMRGAAIADGVALQCSKLFAERNLLFTAERLVAECQQLIAHEGTEDGLPDCCAELLVQIEANHFGGKDPWQGADRQFGGWRRGCDGGHGNSS